VGQIISKLLVFRLFFGDFAHWVEIKTLRPDISQNKVSQQ